MGERGRSPAALLLNYNKKEKKEATRRRAREREERRERSKQKISSFIVHYLDYTIIRFTQHCLYLYYKAK